MQPDSRSKPTSEGDGLAQFPRDPLDDAQELCFDAWESGNPRERVRLAKKALELSPDCADAYVILANAAKSTRRRVELYGKGVAAGERILGPRTFERDIGHFWGLQGTQPYMRARFGLAQALWEVGRREEAITHCSEMLRLNPNDNQGVRYALARYLLGVDRDSDAETILRFYEGDGTADWNYTWVLITFRKEGDSKSACDWLWQAIRLNYHIPMFLLGKRPLPGVLPDEFSVGFESEAVCYVAENATLWGKSPGALKWLAKQLKWGH